jgi:heptosyltransferase III
VSQVRLAASLAPLQARAAPRITVVRSGGLGDTLLLLPTLQLLCAALPGAQLTLVGSAWAEALQPLLPFSLIVRRFDSTALVSLFAAEGCDRLGIFRSDAVILYTDDPASSFVRNAYQTCSGPVVVQPATQIAGRHAALHYAQAVADIGAGDLPFVQLKADATTAGKYLQGIFGADDRVIAVHPGSGGRHKCWPPERFVEVIRSLKVPVMLLEGPADAQACQAVCAGLPQSFPIARAANRSLPEVAGRLKASVLYLGNDSGISHLAAALGVQALVLFGPTDPSVWRPLGPRVTILAGERHGWPGADRVLAALQSLL